MICRLRFSQHSFFHYFHSIHERLKMAKTVLANPPVRSFACSLTYMDIMKLLKKGTKAYSILKMKCPRCQEGDLFETGSFSFKKSFDMPEICSACGQKYFLEPGFYYGAMFISYVITGFFSLAFTGFCILVLGFSINASFAILILILAVLFVWIFRLARAIWINSNVRYNPKFGHKQI